MPTQANQNRNSGSKATNKNASTKRKFDKGIETASKVVKGVSTAANVAGAVISGIKIIKGLFNDPKWYAYRGQMSKLAANKIRPFDSVNAKDIGQAGVPKTPGMGVTHVIYNNVLFQDAVFSSEAFELATAEAFRIIRENLRSNLPYDLTHFRNFVASVLTLTAAAKSVERTLGWYSAVRSDIPELHDAITHAPINYLEKGKVTPSEITIMSETGYPEAINAYGILRDYLRQISVPKKFVEYISWWVGSVFIDQAQPNPQMYINLLRDVPLYTLDNSGKRVTVTHFDVVTSSVQELIDEAKSILHDFGVVNADLIKSGLYGMIDIADMATYQPVAIDDAEFFNVLINTYTQKRSDGPTNNMMSLEYARIDMLPQLDEETGIGAALALTWWSDIAVPFAIKSQAAYFTNDSACFTQRNGSGSVSLNTSSSIALGVTGTASNIFLQHTGISAETTEFDIITTSQAHVAGVTPTTKFLSLAGITPTLVTIYGMRTGSITLGTRNPYGTNLASYLDANGVRKYFNVRFTDNSKTFMYDCSSDIAMDGTTVVFTGESSISTRQTTNSQGYSVYEMYWNNGFTISTTDAAAAMMIARCMTVGSDVKRVDFFGTVNVQYTASANTLNYSITSPNFDATFCEQVDYHIPVISRTMIVVKDAIANKQVSFSQLTQLMKECYIPLSLSYDNVKYTIYHMLLGLFSVDNK